MNCNANANFSVPNKPSYSYVDFRSIALLSHNTLKWNAILGLSFLHSAGGLGNPCYGVQACLVNFIHNFDNAT